MKQLLDGSDWEAGYFISEKEYDSWTKRTRNLHNQLMESARAAGFTMPEGSVGDLMKATVPGCDKTVLLENGLIEDPFRGRNLEHSSWSEKHSWGFRKKFHLSPEMASMRQIRLRFEGIDYQAMIFLNNHCLGFHRGMFIPFETEITDWIDREQENLLAVIFDPAPDGLPDHQDEKPADFADYHRVQCGFGWDWARKIVPTGIWDSVTLIGSQTVRIRDLHWKTVKTHAVLNLETEVLDSWKGTVNIALIPQNFSGPGLEITSRCEYLGGSNEQTIEFDFPEAHFWNPAGYGKPDLYTLSITLDGSTERRTVGFRDLAMCRNPGSPEGAYDLTFEVNGQPIFARGANWVPVDLLPSRARENDYEDLLHLAATAHFNLFRVWGGGLVEKSAFYEACDRHGILVWQEFPHACSNYRKDGEYLAVKEREAEQIVRKLRNHPSTALFCGGNEVQYYGEVPNSPLYLMYARIVKALAPGIGFHTSSPDASRPGERPHGPWNFQEHSFYNTHFRQFASEIGCNALPEAESLDAFIPENEPIPNGQSYRYHFMNLSGAHDIRIPLTKFTVGNGSRREWSQASMYAQADAAGYIFEHYRRLFPRSSGCIFWQYNEPWPTCSWSLLDYYKTPKMAMYRLAAANAPRSFSIEDESWVLAAGKFKGKIYFCTNAEGFAGTVTLELWDGDGNRLAAQTWEVKLSAPVSEVGALEADCSHAAHGIILAVLKAVDESGCEIFRSDRIYGAPDFKNAFSLPAGNIQLSATIHKNNLSARVTNTGKIPVFALRLKCGTPACWKNNYSSLAPGESIICDAEPLSGNSFKSKEQIELIAWNMKGEIRS